jgi:hypothetical protein
MLGKNNVVNMIFTNKTRPLLQKAGLKTVTMRERRGREKIGLFFLHF